VGKGLEKEAWVSSEGKEEKGVGERGQREIEQSEYGMYATKKR